MDGLKMLEMLRGKKTAFIGDSLNRNMYVSLVCMLWHSIPNKTRVVDLTGKIPNSGGIYTAYFAVSFLPLPNISDLITSEIMID